MRKNMGNNKLILLAALSMLIPAQTLCGAPILYLVTVDTNTLSGTTGFLDFVFAAGLSPYQLAIVTVSDLQPAAGVTGTPDILGGVSGTLPGVVTIDNSGATNEYYQGFDFGSVLTFFLGFSGPALSAPDGVSASGSTFGFSMLDAGDNPLLATTSLDGYAFSVDVNLDGTTTPTVFTSGVTLDEVETPEPSALVLACLGIIALSVAWIQNRRRKQR